MELIHKVVLFVLSLLVLGLAYIMMLEKVETREFCESYDMVYFEHDCVAADGAIYNISFLRELREKND